MASYETTYQSFFTITRFRDGDTVEGFLECWCCGSSSKETIRILKIESWEPKGDEAGKAIECAARLTDKFRGLRCNVSPKRPARDPYGRLLADLLIGDMMLSDWLVSNGLAWYGVGEHIHGAYQLPPPSAGV